MQNRQWTDFFDLMEEIITLPRLTAKEKGELVRSEAEARGMDGTLEEFIAEMNEE